MVDHELDELVRRCKAGEQRAWAALVQRYQRLVYAIVMRIGLDEHGAADVFQTVFSRLLEHLPRIVDPQRLQAWVVTTAKREALLQRQRARRWVSITPDDDGAPAWDLADDAAIPEQALDELQQLDGLRRALMRLDERCRSLLAQLFQGGEDRPDYGAVSQALDMPVGSIGPTRARCLDKLRRLMS
jgi:RNA polymerase sigma factor (sigma-70 family)